MTESSIRLEDIPENNVMRSVLKNMGKLQRFRRNVNHLLYSSQKNMAFIQFDIRKFKIVNDLYEEKFGDEMLDFIRSSYMKPACRNSFFINLRSDVFMIVTEYDRQEELLELIHCLSDHTAFFKNVKIQMSYGIYMVEDRGMELRQMEDRAAIARKATKHNVLTNILFYKK